MPCGPKLTVALLFPTAGHIHTFSLLAGILGHLTQCLPLLPLHYPSPTTHILWWLMADYGEKLATVLPSLSRTLNLACPQ